MSSVSAKVMEPEKAPPPAAFRVAACPGTAGDAPILCVALHDGDGYDVRAEALGRGAPLHEVVDQVKAIVSAVGGPAGALVLSDETDVGAVLTVMLAEAGIAAVACSATAAAASPSPWRSGPLEVGERALVARWRSLLQRGLVTVDPGSDMEVLKTELGIRAAALACWLGDDGAAARSGGSLAFAMTRGRAQPWRGRRF